MLGHLEYLLTSIINRLLALLVIPLTPLAKFDNQTAVLAAVFGLRQVRRRHCIIVGLLRKSSMNVLFPLGQNVSFYAHSVHYPSNNETFVNSRVRVGVFILHNVVLVE